MYNIELYVLYTALVCWEYIEILGGGSCPLSGSYPTGLISFRPLEMTSASSLVAMEVLVYQLLPRTRMHEQEFGVQFYVCI